MHRMGQYIIIGIAIVCLIFSLYFQYISQLLPCSLCLMQRLCMFGILGMALFGVYYSTVLTRLSFWIGQWSWIGAGFFFSGRQLWLQFLSDNTNNACLPGLAVLIHYLSWFEILETLLLGSPACGQDHALWLGLPLAAWAMSAFAVIALISLLSWRNNTYAS